MNRPKTIITSPPGFNNPSSSLSVDGRLPTGHPVHPITPDDFDEAFTGGLADEGSAAGLRMAHDDAPFDEGLEGYRLSRPIRLPHVLDDDGGRAA